MKIVLDDVLDRKHLEHIQTIFFSVGMIQYMPWYYIDKMSNGKLDTSGFMNVMCYRWNEPYESNNWLFHVMPVLYAAAERIDNTINEVKIARAYLQMPSVDPGTDNPHIDSPHPHIVGLYYVNDSDGDTFFYDEENNIIDSVSPKENRMVIFPGWIKHSASRPAMSKRCVINFNFTLWKDLIFQ